MKKFLVILVVLAFGFVMFGCGKKQETAQDAMTMEALNTINAPAATAGVEMQPVTAPAATQATTAPAAEVKTEPLATLPSIPAKPTAMDIQTALKNAGYYAGKIDGKIGPMSKKAIEDFQKANGLTADGKVGPKTWAVLGKYLTTTATASSGQVQ
jgi:peptidoglycan hydrolase-like protein with peptidoglycan-binding domain